MISCLPFDGGCVRVCLGTFHGVRFTLSPSLHWVLGFIFLFTVGGLTGVGSLSCLCLPALLRPLSNINFKDLGTVLSCAIELNSSHRKFNTA